MKVVHLLRKPCSEGTVAANVLKYGTGAINVDGCRVGTECGRWPANLILQHLPTCEQTGTREEPGYTVNRFTDGAKPFGGGAGHPYESEHVPPSTVPVWACGAGCPVAGTFPHTKSGRASGYDWGESGNENQTHIIKNIKSGVHFGDTGSASRFFKQVGGKVRGEE